MRSTSLSRLAHGPRRLLFAALCGGLLFASSAALEASTPKPGKQPWEVDDGPRPTAVVKSTICHIRKIEPGRVLLVEDDSGTHRIQISDAIELKAQSRKQFDGRKRLNFGDLEPGQRIKVSFTSEEGRIVRIRVLKDRETKKAEET